jgi:hypothetical protein
VLPRRKFAATPRAPAVQPVPSFVRAAPGRFVLRRHIFISE